jgi:uncharacterized protein YciI
MFIVTLNYVKPLSAIEAHLAAHRSYLDERYAAGDFLFSGPQSPRVGGIIVARGMTRTALDELLAQDPFYQHQVAQYDVIEFVPTKWAPGLDRYTG